MAGKSTTLVYGAEKLKYIIGILNSKLMTFYYKKVFNSMSLAGGFYRIGAPQIKTLPIVYMDNEDKVAQIEKQVMEVQALYDKENYEEAANIEHEIDIAIYEIYGLSEDEIKCVEGNEDES